MKDWFVTLRAKLGFAPKPPLNSKNDLIAFTKAQAAYVSQVTLYGYVKTRAGTQWPKLFENETYLISLKTANWHIYNACVSDLALFLASRVFIHGGIKENQAERLANEISDAVLLTTEQDDLPHQVFVDAAKRSQARAAVLDWSEAATSALTFMSSSDAFMRWAPTADEFKQLDEEIMRNSIHLRWIGIRRDVKETINAPALIAEMEE
ncbi:MAG: hypothetical protein ACON4G_00505 [Candidatus Puniceispirillaceae bacterium]